MTLLDTATVNGLQMGVYGTTPTPEASLDTRILRLHWAKCPNPSLCHWTIWDLGYITESGGFNLTQPDTEDATVDLASIKTKSIVLASGVTLTKERGDVFERIMTFPEDIAGGSVVCFPDFIALSIDGVQRRLDWNRDACASCYRFYDKIPKGTHTIRATWTRNPRRPFYVGAVTFWLTVNLAKETPMFAGVSKLQVLYSYWDYNQGKPIWYSALNINVPIGNEVPPEQPANPPSEPPQDPPIEPTPTFPYWILIPVGLGIGIGLYYLAKHH